MNFIFDLGKVLIDYKPEQFLQKYLNNPQDEAKINELIFKSEEWLLLDRGTITNQQACDIFCKREPEYRDMIIKVMDRLSDTLCPLEQSVKTLFKIKKNGHKLYFLSNFHKDLSEFVQSEYSFFKLFDGGVFSCDINTIKPESKIYRYILDKYEINPKDSVFFDDCKENIVAAEKFGIKGIVFTHASQIEDYLNLIV